MSIKGIFMRVREARNNEVDRYGNPLLVLYPSLVERVWWYLKYLWRERRAKKCQ